MILKFDEFTKAKDLVDKIIKETPIDDIRTELEKATQDINDNETKRSFYNHLSSLFLNVMLNRLEELGNDAKDKSTRARQVINDLIR
jgi:hypothetical protein